MSEQQRVTGATAPVADPEKLWPPMAFRAALALSFGFAALLWPDITVLALALLFGAWSLVDGVSFLVTGLRMARAHADGREWLPWLVAGLLGIAAAAVTVLWLTITVVALSVLVAVLLIGVGVAEIVLAVRVRTAVRGEVFLLIAGILAVVGGLAIAVWPQPEATTLAMVLGGYAIAAGILHLLGAMRLRGLTRGDRADVPSESATARAQPRSP
ncbi:MAG: hypothetical protein QOG46_2387 [Pseudonocardiales bacterium]|jgi:uncharacterized membrane protein HdeD (DUF308 family)|nr:hypothetical protein [Pseudonocardiales bacterium]MDT7713557.1 hypothetical protein [Pseudonocardiales bacterium]